MIRELETLAMLTPEARMDVEKYLDLRGCAYGAILDAHRGDIWAMGKVHGLIVHLARRGHRLKEIHNAAGVEQDYALRVIKESRKQETPIRTTDWGRLISCRH